MNEDTTRGEMRWGGGRGGEGWVVKKKRITVGQRKGRLFDSIFMRSLLAHRSYGRLLAASVVLLSGENL